MNISRKDFLKKSLLSLGEVLFTVKDALTAPSDARMSVPDRDDSVAMPQDSRMAVADNVSCLAKNSCCFACIERCATGAIKLIPGIGVGVNQQLCNGCGTCEYVCPAIPKAVRMHARHTR